MLFEVVPHVSSVVVLPGNDASVVVIAPPLEVVVELDIPGKALDAPIVMPPPSKVVVLETGIPDRALDVGVHVVPYAGTPIVPVGNGLTPGDVSSVAPRGIPVGGTGEPPMPSGEVAASVGDGLPTALICARAGL